MPLIPAQIVDELMDQQHHGNDPTQASPQAMAGIFHPAMQLQLAQALRQRQQGANGQPAMGRAPLADHIRQAKAAGTQGLPVQQLPAQQLSPGAGTMSIQSHPNLGVNGPMPISPQAADQMAWLRTIEGKETGQMPQVFTNHGGTAHTELSAATSEQMNAGARRNRAQLAPGESIQPIAGGYQISGAGPQQAPDPAAGMLNSFKGHVPDHLLVAAQNAIQGGVPLQQVFGHLQTAAQQMSKPQAAAKDNSGKEKSTMLQAKLHHLEHQEDQATEHGEDPATYEKQIQETIGQLGPQQEQQAAVPQPPKAGHPVDLATAQQFLKAAGGDKNKARELAKQAGWSF